MSASAADEPARLLRVLLALETDVALRSLVAQARGDELRRVLRYVEQARVARVRANEAAQKRQEAVNAQARSLESSIDDAIRRARRTRLEMAAQNNGAHASDEEQESKLEGILAQARAVRGDEPTSVDSSTPAPSAGPTRLEYPRRMKLLMEQLEEVEAKEAESSFRSAFCRKMTEHLAVREGGGPREEAKETRVQIGYLQQVERLQHAYRRVGSFLDARADPQSDAVLKALNAPSISSVFPVYCRLKQVRTVLMQLNEASKKLAQRLPPRPVLSQSAVAHRDAMFERLRKKAPTASEAITNSSNRLLLSSCVGPTLVPHKELLDKLQTAWEVRDNRSKDSAGGSTLYDNVLQEAILSEISSLVLSAFRDAFCEGERSPSPSAIHELMGVIRFAESAIVHKGRRQRSVVQR